MLDQAAAISASETAAAAREAAEKAAADQTAEYQAAAEQGAMKARADEEQAAATQAALKAKADEDQAAAERAAMKAREDEQNAVNERAWRKDEAAKKAAERAAKLKAEVDAAAERRTAALTAAETEAKEARIKKEKEEEEKLRAAKLEEAKAKERQRLKALKKQMKAEAAADAAATNTADEQAAIVPAEPHTPEYAHASPSALVPAIVPASPAGEPEAALAEAPSSDSLGSTPTQRRASREEKTKTEVATAKGPPTEPPGDVTAAAEPSCAAHSGNDNASAVEALHQKNLADLHAGAVAAGPMIHLENIAEACEVFSDTENTSGSDSDTTIGFGK